MKYKFLIPTIAVCVGSSLSVGSVRADDTDRTTTTTTYDQKSTISASQVLHARVLDRSGQKIGDVEDIIVDQNSGKAQFAVIKLSGDLADKGKYTPVPFSLLKLSDTQKKDVFGHRDLILQTDREKLLSASRFNTKDWPDRNQASWGQDVYAHYGVPWDSSFGQGATGASFNSNSGTGTSTTTIVEPAPRTYTYYQTTEVRPLSDKPIDNGTGPDGKDTFHFYPRPWPYHDMVDVH